MHDDTAVRLESAREVIEIATVARQSMNAQDDMWIGGVAPVGVGDLMKPVRVEAREALSIILHPSALGLSAAV